MNKTASFGKYFSWSILIISVCCGLAAFLLLFSGINVSMSGTIILTDPREVFVTISAALTGPVGSMITSLLAGFYNPSADIRLYSIIQHIIASLLLSVCFKFFVYKKIGTIWFYFYWVVLIFCYYYVFFIPGLVFTMWFFPRVYQQINLDDLAFIPSLLRYIRWWFPEALFTATFTTMLLFALPGRFRKPLWGKTLNIKAIKRGSDKGFSTLIRMSLPGVSIRLFFILILFSTIPLISMGIIIRNNVVRNLLDNEGKHLMEQAKIYTGKFKPGTDWTIPELSLNNPDNMVVCFLDTANTLTFASNQPDSLFVADFNHYPELHRTIYEASSGIWYNNSTMRAAGFITEPQSKIKIICYNHGLNTGQLVKNMTIELAMAFAEILFLFAFLTGIMIWFIVGRPIKWLTYHADQMSQGKYFSEIREEEMDDEIRVLASSFNRMQKNIRQAIDDLHNREFLLRTVLANTPVIHFILDEHGKIKLILGKSLAHLGIEESAATGVSVYDLFAHQPEVIDLVGNAYNGKEDRKVVHVEDAYFEMYVCPVRNSEGEIISVIGVANDITERRNLETDLRQAADRAEESDKLKSILLANMSHELRTPMSGILGYTAILLDSINDDSYRSILKRIIRSSNRLLTTLNSVMSITEIESGMVPVAPENLEIVGVTRYYATPFIVEAEEKKLTLKINQPDKMLNCEIDTNIYRQLLANILDNAVKFTEKGSIQIDFEAVNENGANKVMVHVSDTGIGIAEENLQLIFSDFKQLSEGYNRRFEGLGLGLSNAKRLAILLNAEIRVQSQLNSGSVFTLVLPAAEK